MQRGSRDAIRAARTPVESRSARRARVQRQAATLTPAGSGFDPRICSILTINYDLNNTDISAP